jgi:hypothetical protein
MFFRKEDKILNKVASKPRDIFMPHPSLGWKLRPNSKIQVWFRDIVQSTDDEGWRTVMHQPKTSKHTVAFYGCSFTYGTALSDSETFTSLIQESFPEQNILNRGIGGHGTVQNYIQFRNDVKNGKVDMAVFCAISDHRYRNIGHPVRMKAHLSPKWYEIGVEHIPIVTLDRNCNTEIEYISIWQPSLLKNDFERFLPPDYYLDKATIEMFRTIGRFATEHKIPYKIVLLDSIDPVFNQIITEQVDDVVDISTPFNSEFNFIPNDVHPNVKANKVFFDRLVPLLNEMMP